jgi:hypothetical protein
VTPDEGVQSPSREITTLEHKVSATRPIQLES